MTTTLTPANTVGEMLLVDLSKTVGQASAINDGNGGNPLVVIKVTEPAVVWVEPTGEQSLCGFGTALTESPLAGHEVAYTLDSIAAVGVDAIREAMMR